MVLNKKVFLEMIKYVKKVGEVGIILYFYMINLRSRLYVNFVIV